MKFTTSNNALFASFRSLVVLFPVVMIIIGLLLLIFVVPGSYAQFSEKISSYRKDRELYDTLQKKLTILQSTSPLVLEQTVQAVGVMPERNPALPFISTMKNLAIDENVIITGIKTNSVNDIDGEIKKLELEITMEADSFEAINKLLASFTTRAPIITLDEITVTDLDSSTAARAKISVYWSNLPKTLSPVTDPLPAFSPEELTTIERMNTFTLPEFTTLSPGNTAPRENPFN